MAKSTSPGNKKAARPKDRAARDGFLLDGSGDRRGDGTLQMGVVVLVMGPSFLDRRGGRRHGIRSERQSGSQQSRNGQNG